MKSDDLNALWSRVISDYRFQQACLEGMKEVLGADFVDPREYKGTRGKESGGRYVSKKGVRQKGVPQNVYTIPYLMWAYDVNKCTFKRRLKNQKMGIALVGDVAKPNVYKGQSVIENRELALERYNAKFFYAHEKAMVTGTPTCDDQRVPDWTISEKSMTQYWPTVAMYRITLDYLNNTMYGSLTLRMT